ncbi:hypothetical protein BGZ65_009730 [Modicella reniformis]|uniref:Translin n=1 Tax=Modicella reniformis TaxID=1440133 RepID=A0A9P6IP55_9FUNG|nr:hypothetical protein BGZ65_009730 [Modicella reniformis]
MGRMATEGSLSNITLAVSALCAQAYVQFQEVKAHIQEVAKIVPTNQYYKYNNLWSGPMQQACFLATLTMYLEHERLITSRLAVNAVTAGDFARPVRIGKFLKELYSGFQLLNLKNDGLRKRFDAIKYDIKKVEEIIYDLTVRNLIVASIEPAQQVDSESHA